ncbi:MAG: 30S ribosomal protein S4 [Candidatus Nanohaloarchaea archaeon]
MVKKLKKQFETPNEGWNEERINREDELVEEYGLSSKTEIYRAQSRLRGFRRQARKLAASEKEEAAEDFLDKLNRLGLIREQDSLEEVLSLNMTDVLDRRLQTAVDRRGYSETVRDARQMVVHGHVYVDGQRVTVPGYLLDQEEEGEIEIRMPEEDGSDEKGAEAEGDETDDAEEEDDQ